MFWPASRRRELRDILATTAHEPTSILMLRDDIHTLWDAGRFCLEPIATEDHPDPNVLRLKFLWLTGTKDDSSTLSFETPEETDCVISNPRTHTPVQSGDMITLETDDPTEYPLPNAKLLKLQSDLHKALRAAARAEDLELVFQRDGDGPKVPAAGPQSTPSQSQEDQERFPFPHLAEYYMNEAVSHGIIHGDEVPYWRTMFDPACPDPSLPLWHNHEDDPLVVDDSDGDSMSDCEPPSVERPSSRGDIN